MRRILFASLFACTLGFASLGAAAQQLKIESQGQAEQESQKAKAVARSMAQSIGEPAAGMGQVVFFRSSKSPGDGIDVAADGVSAGNVDAGMYLAMPASPGVHAYGPGTLSLKLKAGETRYVQVIRNRAGAPQLRLSDATRFQNAARQSR